MTNTNKQAITYDSLCSNLNKGVYNYEVNEIKKINQDNVSKLFEIVCPILDEMRDSIEIYLEIRKNGDLILTDDGHVECELFLLDINLDDKEFFKQVDAFLHCYNIERDTEEINGKCINIKADQFRLAYHIEQFASAISSMCIIMTHKFFIEKNG